MASKPTFAKLGLKKKNEITHITINDLEIAVKQYLPMEDKIKIVTNILQNSADDNNFANPMKIEVFTNLEIIFNYTDIVFTDKQKEDPLKLYNLLEENEIFDEVIEKIPAIEYNNLIKWIDETIKAFYDYKTSALGIMEEISTDYSNLNFDATEIQKNIADPNNLTLLKNVVEKLG